MRIQDVITKPIITEKALSKGSMQGYMFEVARSANKDQIRNTVESLFKVEVKSVKTLVRKGKTRRAGRRSKTITMPDVKKAYVVLKKGSIDIIPKA